MEPGYECDIAVHSPSCSVSECVIRTISDNKFHIYLIVS